MYGAPNIQAVRPLERLLEPIVETVTLEGTTVVTSVALTGSPVPKPGVWVIKFVTDGVLYAHAIPGLGSGPVVREFAAAAGVSATLIPGLTVTYDSPTAGDVVQVTVRDWGQVKLDQQWRTFATGATPSDATLDVDVDLPATATKIYVVAVGGNEEKSGANATGELRQGASFAAGTQKWFDATFYGPMSTTFTPAIVLDVADGDLFWRVAGGTTTFACMFGYYK